jgi:cytochrome c-type biogenesis protein CcmF
MAELGHVSIVAALLLSAFCLIVGPLGVAIRGPNLALAARNAVVANAALLTVASGTLLTAFLVHDFSIRYVADHSSRDMPRGLVAAAFYSGQQGSLLYWAWTFALFGAIVALRHDVRSTPSMPYVLAALSAVTGFFTFLMSFISSPFERLAPVPPDGLGLNPLLYDYGMLIHPPMLLAGYMSWGIPFAFAVGALASGRLDNEWLALTRRYSLIAWGILGLGNLLGGWWAYRVLGWGGYWGWDPVENSAFMPWLLGTAFIHSIMIQERRGMLKVWNLVLILTTFYLCLFGTFIVRSGIIQSVHSFAQSAIGPYFLWFLTAVVVSTLGLLFWRLPLLRSENRLDSSLSREAAFLLNNLLFLALVFAIFWGTIFPLVAEAVQGARITVGPPYFNQVASPIMLTLIALMGLGPLLPWRRTTVGTLIETILAPVGVGLCFALIVAVVVGFDRTLAIVTFGTCAMVAAAVLQEFTRGTVARSRATGESALTALWGLTRRNNRRYGGYVVHIGIVVMTAAVAGSSYYQLEREAKLNPGDTVDIGDYRLQYLGLSERREPGYRAVEARLDVYASGRPAGTLVPEKRFHRNFERQPSTEVAIRTTPLDDLYVVLVGWEETGAASFLIYVNPLVVWLWIGGALSIAGGVFSFWPTTVPRLSQSARDVPSGAVSPA